MRGAFYNLVNFINTTSINDVYANAARKILQNIYVIPGSTITDVAELCFVSTATISRLCRKLNYESFADFKMDITECSGEYTEFIENWYFEKQDLAYYHGIHLPVISGELDAPWFRIPQEEDVKTDEERILEAFSRYAYGIDTLNFSLLTEALANDLVVNMAPWGAMDKREFMQTLKYKRQAVRYWNHPALLDCVLLHENSADLRLHRMAGHRQSAMPIIFTKENYDIQYADARYEIKMIKEDGIWKILRMDYFLGTIQLGKFSDLQ